jgi:hypothetical protein
VRLPGQRGDLLKAAHRHRKLIGSLAGGLENSEQASTLVAARQELLVRTAHEMNCNQAAVTDGIHLSNRYTQR